MKLHIGKEGDTVISLSDKYGVEPERILEANPQLSGTTAIERGMKVKIPSGPVSMQQTIGNRTERVEQQPAQANAPTQAEAAQAQTNPPTQVQPTQANPPTTPVEATQENAPAQTLPAQTNGPAAVQIKPLSPKAAPMFPLGMEESTKPAEQGFAFPNLVNPYGGAGGALPTSGSTAPTHYKTEPAEGNASPLHVKWSGMNTGNEAVHPFAQFHTPAVPAGASPATSYPAPPAFQPAMSGFPGQTYPPQGQMPYDTPWIPEMASTAPYGMIPEPFAPQFPFVPFAGGGAGDCGCGGPSPNLPYALPQQYGNASPFPPAQQVPQAQAPQQAAPQAADGSRASISGAATLQATPQTAEAAQQGGAASKTKAAKKTAKKKAKVSSRTDSLRSFLKRAQSVRRRSSRGSRPWVNE